MKISEWIAQARANRGWTQGLLAEALNVTRGNISAWENGRHEPSLSQIKRISELCGIDATVLLTDGDIVTKLPTRDSWPFSFPASLLNDIAAPRLRELELIMLGFIAESKLLGGKPASGVA